MKYSIIVFAIFLTLQLMCIVSWPWWVVTSPLWIPLALSLALTIASVIFSIAVAIIVAIGLNKMN